MTTLTRIKNGSFISSGTINERVVSAASHIQSYPMDGTLNGYEKDTLVDPSKWKVGTTGDWTVNGESNQVVLYENPWGDRDVMWASFGNDAARDDEAGWNKYFTGTDYTKKYRFSVWVRRENAVGDGGGTTYFGCGDGSVHQLGTSSYAGNPYFAYNGTQADWENKWILYVDYVHPYGSTLAAFDGTRGQYNTIGEKVGNITGNYPAGLSWAADGWSVHRTYLYYSTKTDERIYFYQPRVEMCDGSEPTIAELCSGVMNVKKVTDSAGVITERGHELRSGTTNLITGEMIPVSDGWGDIVAATSNLMIDTPFGTKLVPETTYAFASGGLRYFDSPNVINCSPNTTYTVSYFIRYSANLTPISHPNNIYIRQYTGPASAMGSQISEYGIATNMVDYGNGWWRIYSSFPAASNCNSFSISGYNYAGSLQLQNWLQFFGLNCTAGAILHPWQAPSYSGIPETNEFPIKVRNGDFTITGQLYRNIPIDASFASNNWEFGLRHQNGSYAILRYYNPGTMLPWIDADGLPGKPFAHEHANAGIHYPAWQWLPFYMHRTGNDIYFGLKNDVNGPWYEWHTGCAATDSFRSIWLCGHANTTFKNINVYNTYYNKDQINALLKIDKQVMLTGAFNYNEYQEHIPLPRETHYPLTASGQDEFKHFNPVVEQNTVYENGSVWVGPAVTNLFRPSSTGFHPVLAQYGGWSVSHYNENLVIYKFDLATGGYGYNGTDNEGNGTPYAYSMDVYLSSTSLINVNKFVLNVEQSASASYYIDGTVQANKSKWHNFNQIATASGNTRFLMYPYNDGNPYGYILYRNPMLSNTNYHHPFCATTRGAGKLTLPITLAQNTNFTISMWVTTGTKGPHRETFDVFCDDSDRWNGQFRITTDQIEFLVRANARGATSNLYATCTGLDSTKWNLFTLVSIAGYGSKVYFNGNMIGNWANVYPQYTNLSVGRHGDGDAYVQGAYFRNLTVHESVLSDAEILSIYKTKTRISPSINMVNNEIIEDSELV